MPFDPERWLQVADVCCINIPQVDSEALLRTAINRAYYAALLSVKRRVEDVQGLGTVPATGTHHSILQALHSGGREFREVQRELRDLRDLRSLADYELETEPLVPILVVKYLGRSRRLIRKSDQRDPGRRVPSAPRAAVLTSNPEHPQ